jgi:hypothetical protein
MAIKGAGGTEGGIGSFFLGLAMMIGGGYLFLTSIQVVNQFHLGYRLFRLGSMPVTSGMVMLPFVFGIGIIFYNAKNLLGWFLAVGSLVMLGFGVISSIHFRLRSMSAFELIVIVVLLIGGLGLFLRSLKSFGTS